MGGFGSITPAQQAALDRNAKASANLKAKKTNVSDEAKAKYSMFGASPKPQETPHEGGFVGRVADRAQAAVDGEGRPESSGTVDPFQGEGQAPAQPAGPDEYDAISGGTYGLLGGQNAARMADEKRTVRKANKLHGAKKERIASGDEVNANRRRLAEDSYAAEQGKAQATADGMDLIAETQMDIQDRQMETERRQAERHVEMEQRVRDYDTQMSEAVAQVQNAQKIDPSAGWTNKSAGQKVRMVLASMFRGGAGRDPMAYLTRAVAQEVDAQKSNAQKDIQAAEMSMGAYKTGVSGMRDTFMAISSDERAADKMTEIAMFETARSQLVSAQSAWDATGQNASAAKALNELDDTIAERKLELRTMEASNPKYFTRKVYTHGESERRFLNNVADQDVKNMGEAQKAKIGNFANMQKVAQEAIASGRPEGMAKEAWEQVRQVGSDKKYGQMQQAIRMGKEILAYEDIPGIGQFGEDFLSIGGDEVQQLARMKSNFAAAVQRLESQGVISSQELETFMAELNQGTGAANFTAPGGAEGNFRRNVEGIMGRIEAQAETQLRAMHPEAEAYLNRGQATQFDRESQEGGFGRRRVTDADGNVAVSSTGYE